MQLSENLNNRYFILRHGQSHANVAEIILSHPEEGAKEEHTLTTEGENQVRESAEQARLNGILGEDTIIYSSPFSRCRRTAEVAKEVLGVKQEIIFDDRLRERWFGDWERKHNSNYQKVWDEDVLDAEHKKFNVESAKEVQDRTLSLANDLESQYVGKKILLVSHGDALQIMQTGFLNKSPKVHRELPHLETAEIRELIPEV